MLDTKRIKEAESNVSSYLKEGLLKKRDADKQVIEIFTRNAKEFTMEMENILLE